MKPVVIFDFIGFLGVIVAATILIKGWKHFLERDLKFLFLGLISLSLFHNFSNILEWTGYTKAVDPFEDFVEILVPMFWFFVFYAYLQKLAVNRVRESEKYYRTLIQTLHEDIMVIDSDYRVTDVNHSLLVTLGARSEDVIGERCYRISHGNDEPCYLKGEKCMLREVFEKGEPRIFRHEHHKKDGPNSWVDIILSPMVDDQGKVTHVVEAARDITELREAEKAIVQSEEKYRLLVENANDAIFVAQDNIIKFPNPKCEELVGYSSEELSRMPFGTLIHPEDRDMVIDRHRRRLAGEELATTYSFRIFNRQEEELLVQLNTVMIDWEGRPATLNFIRDITEHKKLEEQFQHSQRMESIGTLAGGIAHDFNNLLMGIQGNASLMLIEKDPLNPDFERLKNIEKYVRDGSELTNRLLGFARGGKYETRPTDINQIVKKSSRMFGRTKKEINIHLKCQEGIWPAEVDQGQIEQVLLNLYVNSWQAMPGGGDLYIETQNINLSYNFTEPFDLEPGQYVKISVTDTGVGMDEATRQKIFDPFFTTKDMGRGTGLGLASAYGIIKNHSGIIAASSEKGKGATFNIYLPVSDKEIIEEILPSEQLLRGSETILLVDDEDMVLDISREMLERVGYDVLLARTGKEALDLYGIKGDTIDLVILDMIMPDMNGGEVFDRLKKMDANIRVLLSSGYSIDGEAAKIMKRGCSGFIQKPFDMKQLSSRIREILEK